MHQLQGRQFIADSSDADGFWLQKYIHHDDQPRVLAAIKEAIASKSVFQLEHRVKRADGSLGWTFSRAFLIDQTGQIIEWLGTATDISERKRAEQLLAAAARWSLSQRGHRCKRFSARDESRGGAV